MQAVGRLAANAAEFEEAARGSMADHLAVCVAVRLALSLGRLPGLEDNPEFQLERLRELCVQTVALGKSDPNAERLKIERQKLELDSQKYKDRVEEKRKKEGAKSSSACLARKSAAQWLSSQLHSYG